MKNKKMLRAWLYIRDFIWKYMAEPSFLSKFSINSPNRFVLYIAGISFILTLISQMQGIDMGDIRHGSLVFIVIGLINWIFENIQRKRYAILENENSDEEYMSQSVKNELITWTFFEFSLLIISYLIGCLIVFSN